jgi:hypothetical protein
MAPSVAPRSSTIKAPRSRERNGYELGAAGRRGVTLGQLDFAGVVNVFHIDTRHERRRFRAAAAHPLPRRGRRRGLLPDGRIVFAHFRGDEPLPHWYLIRPDGSHLRSLPQLHGAGDPIDWLP